ncbi:GNAT family N-acetyltransferase [Fontimonas sp. SYSU GA230001]|uniref:bifunctional acetate--CoA ligase family protein/GNAT family N-acetyltransferase n=1 Tax=Fontimonas sp. SYSU GA230001 TaxID=3142450 RepID=UPI0032B4135C
MSIRNLDALFRPDGVVVVGPPRDAPGAELLARLDALAPQRRSLLAGTRSGWTALRHARDVRGAELAVVLDPAAVTPAVVRALCARGCRALIWFAESAVPTPILRAGHGATLRVLGPRTAGVAHALGISASAWALPAAGTTALIAQSRSITSAALDWAAGHALGFSWMAVTGGEADVDVGDLLDYAALDPRTHAVVLQLSRIGAARKFMSAARACARAKPVIVLQTARPEGAPQAQDPVLSAAFRRAGLVEVDRVTALFSALAALDRVGEAATGRIAVIGTGTGVCQLAFAALLREGLTPAAIGDAARSRIQQQLPVAEGCCAEAINVDLADDDATVAALRAALSTPDVDTVMFVRSPSPGRDDESLARKLVSAGLRERLVVVFLGQQRAAPALRCCAQGRIAAFASVEAAARALRYRREHRRTQELLMQTPTLDPLVHAGGAPPALAPARRGSPPRTLPADEAQALLGAYGLLPAAWIGGESRGLRVHLRRHAQLGMYLEARLDPASAAAPTAHALPPLDDVVAEITLGEAGLGTRSQAPPGLRIRDYALAVARLAQLAAEQPLLREAEVRLVPADDIAEVGHARIVADAEAPPERQRLALAPYPAALEHVAQLRDGRPYRIRAIHPTDEPALIRMLSQAGPEDIRLRFFRYIRQFTHAMAARMTQIDYDREISFVAVPHDNDDEVLGLSTLVFDPDGREAEFAVLIRREYAGQRLGLQLMQDLIHYAAARGAHTVHGDVLVENAAMLGLAQRLGFRREPHPDDPGCVRVVITPQLPKPPPPWTKSVSCAHS